ncbi:hypothetical protein BKA63DRAFT_527750 [Paraphoma chrysanthemicola]|nr:hypothetical protein BKA63DRAFT_527750 [Paraphoma chrysanthemicola]
MKDPSVQMEDTQEKSEVTQVNFETFKGSKFMLNIIRAIRTKPACPTVDCGLAFSASKLHLIPQRFISTIITDLYQEKAVYEFGKQHIEGWYNGKVMASFKCGPKMPTFSVKLSQFKPKGVTLQHHLLHMTSGPRKQLSVDLAMEQTDLQLLDLCNAYIKNIVGVHMDNFADLYWADEDDRDPQFLKLINSYGKHDLIQDARELIVVTFILSHTLTINAVFGASKVISDAVSLKEFQTSRFANRQFKCLFCVLQEQIMGRVLNKLQQTFKSTNSYNNWLPACLAIIVLCMVCEEHQKTIHLVINTKVNEQVHQRTTNDDADDKTRDDDWRQLYERQGESYCRDIGSSIDLVMRSFHRWSGQSLQDMACGRRSKDIVWQIIELVEKHRDFLERRKCIPIASANWRFYTSRSVAKFLLQENDSAAVPTWLESGVYGFRQYTIEIPELVLRPLASLLAKLQAAAISEHLLQEVEQITRVHILGFLQDKLMACAMVNLPSGNEVLKEVIHFPLSFVKESGKVVSGIIIASVGVLKTFADDERGKVFSELDKHYSFILESIGKLRPGPAFANPMASLTQADHNVLYARHYLAPVSLTQMSRQLSTMDEATGVSRAMSDDAVANALADAERRWDFGPASRQRDKRIGHLYNNPEEWLKSEMILSNSEAGLYFEMISSSSKAARDQRARIEGVKHKL